MEIRHIQENDDRLSVSHIYEEGWKFAYRGIVPQDYLDSIPPGRWVPYLDQDGVHSLMMTEDGKLIGTSSYSKSRTAQFHDFGEIISIYLLPEYMGRGYGRLLLEAAVKELEKVICGENDSLEYVDKDLCLVPELSGYPFRIEWESLNHRCIDMEGKLDRKSVV